jgi:hypothetical protein
VLTGDLVTVSGAYYDTCIDQHDPSQSIRHYMGFMTTKSVGVVLGTSAVYSEKLDRSATIVWHRVLTPIGAFWFPARGVASLSDLDPL